MLIRRLTKVGFWVQVPVSPPSNNGSTLADLAGVQSSESKVRFLKGLLYTSVTQWIRVLAYEAGSRRFESFQTCHNNGVSSVVAAHLSVKQVERVRFPLSPQKVFCPGDGIGIRVGLRSQILGVRVSSGAPSFQRLWRNR